jgi:serine/threonine protein kinase
VLGIKEARQQTFVTAAGMVVGTAAYMAPELIMGQPFDGRVDQYALAVTVYEVLSGRLPFLGESAAVFVQHCTQPVPPLTADFIPALSPGIWPALSRGLDKDPNKRYPSCLAMAQELLAVVGAEKAASARKKNSGRAPFGQASPGEAAPSQETGPAQLVIHSFSCPECKKRCNVPAKWSGRRVRCRWCDATFEAPYEALPFLAKAPAPPRAESKRNTESNSSATEISTPTERKPRRSRRKSRKDRATTREWPSNSKMRKWIGVSGCVLLAILLLFATLWATGVFRGTHPVVNAKRIANENSAKENPVQPDKSPQPEKPFAPGSIYTGTRIFFAPQPVPSPFRMEITSLIDGRFDALVDYGDVRFTVSGAISRDGLIKFELRGENCTTPNPPSDPRKIRHFYTGNLRGREMKLKFEGINPKGFGITGEVTAELKS